MIYTMYLFFAFVLYAVSGVEDKKTPKETTIILPKPKTKGTFSVEEALSQRRSTRHYSSKRIELIELSQILWAAQGITDPDGLRTAPSAGALFPLELLVVVGNVEGLEPAIYRYSPQTHALTKHLHGDKRRELCAAALRQQSVCNAPCTIVINAIFERVTKKYGERGKKYVYMEVGHVSQNIYLQATALNIKTVAIGAFYDEQVFSVLQVPRSEIPLYLMPIGK